jgi:hypothetical protein
MGSVNVIVITWFWGTAEAEAAGTAEAIIGGASSSTMSPSTPFAPTVPDRCAIPEPIGSWSMSV